MEKLIQVEENEVKVEFELERKWKTTIHLRNLLQTMHVAFKVQTTSPHKFAVNPPNGFIDPQGKYSLDVILKPPNELPTDFPLSKDVILIKAVAAVDIKPGLRVPKDWFAARQAQGTWDERLRVIYTGPSLLKHVVETADEEKLLKMLKLRDLKSYINEGDKESGRTALHIAAAKGNVEIAKLLMDRGADKAATSFTGQTPLHEAVCSGSIAAVEALLDGNGSDNLELGALKDSRGRNPLHLAAALNHLSIVHLLLDKFEMDPDVRDNDGMTPLHIAAAQGHVGCVGSLLDGGADVDAVSFDGSTALFTAASTGHVAAVEALLDFCANKFVRNNLGQTASDQALENGHMQIVQVLEYGDEFLNCARSGDVEKVIYWVKKGASLDWSDQFGWTALHCAALKGHLELAKKLIELGADIEAKDSEGHTPLHCAAYGGRPEIVELFVENGGDVKAETVRTATPFTIAKICSLPSPLPGAAS